jgi:hypothetical protein
MGTLTRFLESIMNSTLLGLPREIKELIYFDALSHAANKILVRDPSQTNPFHFCHSNDSHKTCPPPPRPSRSPPTSKRSTPTAWPPWRSTWRT